MNTQRITISLPDYLYQQLAEYVPTGTTSRFVAEIIEKELWRERIKKKTAGRASACFKPEERLPERSIPEILEAIHRGRG